jgi:hypothetical protein
MFQQIIAFSEVKKSEWLTTTRSFLSSGKVVSRAAKEDARRFPRSLFGPGYGRFLQRHLVQFSSIPIASLPNNSRQEGKTVLKYEQSARVVRAATSLFLTSDQENTNIQAKIF